MTKNRYRKALTHLKSTKIDEKIQRLNEAPTNSISGVYANNPAGFRLADPDPERIFYADVDGNWPAGIPGENGELTYTRPPGYWDKGPGTVPANQTTETRDFITVSGVNGTNTDNFIRSSDGFVLADLPPGTRNFILGPLVDAYVLNHGSYYNDDYTNIGYIQKDTRQFVLLGRISGTWSKAQSVTIGPYTSTIWNGTDGFISYNANFTLEHALWFRQKMLSGKYTAAVPYKYSGGIPQLPDPNNPGFYNGYVPDDGKAGGPSDDQGTPQVPANHGGPDPNLVPGSANPNIATNWGLYDYIWTHYGLPAAEWYKSNPGKPPSSNPFLPKGAYVPLAGAKSGDDLIAGGLYPSNKYDPVKSAPYIQDPKIYGGSGKNTGSGDSWDPNDPSTWPSIKNQVKQASIDNEKKKKIVASYEPQGQVLTETRQRILREIKKPVKVSEPPKQKLEKYRPNFAGKYTPQNTPDVTASPKSDEMVKAKNAAGQTWRTKDKHWARYESTERMNIIFDTVGHGSQYWDMIVNENQMKKVMRDRKIQEQLNIIAHEKAMLKENPLYESPFRKAIQEQETLQADKDPLFKKVKNKLKQVIDYPDKPSKLGYPDQPPAESINGWHPEYGQKSPFYNKLDPQSADAMPSTGNDEIDAKVKRAKTLKKALGKKA